jgi:hypothetical protein
VAQFSLQAFSSDRNRFFSWPIGSIRIYLFPIDLHSVPLQDKKWDPGRRPDRSATAIKAGETQQISGVFKNKYFK